MLNYYGRIGKIQVQVLENLLGVAARIGIVEHVQALLDYNNDIQITETLQIVAGGNYGSHMMRFLIGHAREVQITEAILITVAGKQDEAVETMRAVFGQFPRYQDHGRSPQNGSEEVRTSKHGAASVIEPRQDDSDHGTCPPGSDEELRSDGGVAKRTS